MASFLRIAAFVVLALPITSAEARDAAADATNQRDRVARETSQKFSARLGRLDALMGGIPRNTSAPRARSADAAY